MPENKNALAEQTILKENYTIHSVIASDSHGITYLAEDAQKRQFRIREFFPCCLVTRAEELQMQADGEIDELKEQFRATAQILQNTIIRHMPCAIDYFEENQTCYCVFPWNEALSLQEKGITITPAYLRSLGLLLCEFYDDLHNASLFYGTLSSSDVLFDQYGHMHLIPDRLFASSYQSVSSIQNDLHCMSAFLLQYLQALGEDYEEVGESPSYDVLKNALSYCYPDAQQMSEALLCTSGTVKPPVTSQFSLQKLLAAAFCTLVLVVGVFFCIHIASAPHTLTWYIEHNKIEKGVISVWVPIDEDADIGRTQKMYQRLTEGFEKKNPGYGVELFLFADQSFSDALANYQANAEGNPVVFMNAAQSDVLSLATDITPLTSALQPNYLCDLSAFTDVLSLGCSFPVAYYHKTQQLPEGETLLYQSIAEQILHDASVLSVFASENTGSYSDFQSGNLESLLASTAYLAEIERNAALSGSVAVYPVLDGEQYPIMYEMPCVINIQAGENEQLIGMLWLQYLMTEEAQTILFSENYGILPLHKEVFAYTARQHDALKQLPDLIGSTDKMTE